MSAEHSAEVVTPRQQASQRRSSRVLPCKPNCAVRLCISEDQHAHLSHGQVLPSWPAGAPLPRMGEVIYLTSTSAWGVAMVIHELLPGGHMRVEVWLEHVHAARHQRSPENRFLQ